VIDIASYKENGYVLLERFFAPEQIAAVRDDARQVFLAQMLRSGIVDRGDVGEADFERGMVALFQRDLPAFTNCGKHAQHLISLHALSLDPRIVAALHGLGLAFPSISTRPVLYFNSPQLARKEVYWRLSLHQDWRSMQGSLDAVVVWVPLVDIDRSLGALEVIPGSHRWGLLEADMVDGYGHVKEEVDRSRLRPLEVRAGDALLFSAFLVHQSGTNTTGSIRWSCHFRYNNLRERTFVERGFPHPYVYGPQEALITAGFPRSHDIEELFRP
jgi:ectoine hydroxylase-related dioxygenase (phytanoyl-CoA dioxygenase family)